jgi:isopentenyl diphosphate isomerase/L-lactate dehydrogenase-like FMN-dependent dehydrogenase
MAAFDADLARTMSLLGAETVADLDRELLEPLTNPG